MPHVGPPIIARRFRVRARLITAGAIAGAVLVAVGGALAMAAFGGPREGGIAAYAVAILGLLVLIVGLAAAAAPRVRSLRLLRERHPDRVAFLARRLPAVVSDMPQYLAAHGLQLEIGPGWYIATAYDEGIGVWASGRAPQHLLTIPWDEVGDVLAVRTRSIGGDERWSVTVDVTPYVEPLTVEVGFAWGIVTMAMDASDTADVVAAVNAQRPTP